MIRLIALIIACVLGWTALLSFFSPPLEGLQSLFEEWYLILSAIAFFLGGANLGYHHLRKISEREAGWGYSAITMISFLAILIVGIGKLGVPPNPHYPELPASGRYDEEGGALWWAFQCLYTPLVATVFSLLAFYVVSAAFRAFRAKNTEATILLATAAIILLGQTFVGNMLTAWVPDEYSGLTMAGMKVLIFNTFTTSGQRAIMIGIALGVAATSLRIILGIDRPYSGGEA